MQDEEICKLLGKGIHGRYVFQNYTFVFMSDWYSVNVHTQSTLMVVSV